MKVREPQMGIDARYMVVLAAQLVAALLAGCESFGGHMDVQPAAFTARDSLDARPRTIPALREWTPGNGAFQLTEGSRIVLAASDAALESIARLFAGEAAARVGFRPAVVIDASATDRAGDLRFMRAPVAGIESNEGYRLEVGASMTVRAPSDAGVFYATRTILQLLDQGSQIPAGVAEDWPRYPERGMMLDIARKRYSAAWLEERIRELAYLKMNYLHLHISDDKAFGIDTEKVPDDPPLPGPPRLSKDAVAHLSEMADAYFVTLLPEIDMPGHMGAILSKYESFRYSDGPGQTYPNVLDITNPEAVAFAKSLITEIADLFKKSKSWHSGGDEILLCFSARCHPKLTAYARRDAPRETSLERLDGKDALHLFFNDLHRHVQKRNLKLRVWNDELQGGDVIPLDREIIVHWWTQFSILSDWMAITPAQLLSADHLIVNNGVWPTYYVLGAPSWLPNSSMKAAYESWEVNTFDGYLHPIRSQEVPAAERRNLGAGLCVWADKPEAETEQQVAEHIFMRLRVIAQKTWSSKPFAAAYDSFAELARELPLPPAPLSR